MCSLFKNIFALPYFLRSLTRIYLLDFIFAIFQNLFSNAYIGNNWRGLVDLEIWCVNKVFIIKSIVYHSSDVACNHIAAIDWLFAWEFNVACCYIAAMDLLFAWELMLLAAILQLVIGCLHENLMLLAVILQQLICCLHENLMLFAVMLQQMIGCFCENDDVYNYYC